MSNRKSIPELLAEAADAVPNRLFLNWINPADPEATPLEFTYAAFETMVRKAVHALREIGLREGDRMLFLAENSPAWQVVAIAAQTLKLEVAALFPSIGMADVVDIVCRVQPRAVFVGSEAQWTKLHDVLAGLGVLPRVLVADESILVPQPFVRTSTREVFEGDPVTPEEFRILIEAVADDSPFILIFTSGTTGRQKGVRLTQAAAAEALEAGIAATNLKADDLGLHILPFAHIAGLCAFYAALKVRGGLILCSRREDLTRGFSFRPTYTLLVPLIYERIRKEVLKGIEKKPPFLADILRSAIDAASRGAKGVRLGTKGRILASLAQRLVGGALRKKLGGRIHLLGAGGALSEAELVAFYRGLGFDYLNFYGMSETCGIISLSRIDDRRQKVGAVGRPWSGLEVKIAPDGEILVRGKTLMKGYLEQEGNAEAFAPDGFFRTGDLGSMDEEGFLSIKGRKKNIFVLSTGKKVFPEQVELKLRQTLPIADAVLVGDGRAFVAAGLFIPHEEMQQLSQEANVQEIKASFLQKIRRGLSEFSDFEIPKNVFLIEGAPYDYPKIVTPTLKIKRNVFVRTFSSQIREIYGPSSGA